MSEGFFGRWSRRKAETAGGQTPVPEPSASRPQDPPELPSAAPLASRTDESPAAGESVPTLDDAQALTPASDFQPFMQRGVVPEVRNAAMKKLFSDPHFNVMDGLDIYIDDYSQPDPLPAGTLRRMASAQFLKLVPEEEPQAQAGEPDLSSRGLGDGLLPAKGEQVVAQSPDSSANAETPSYDHPDLQLQPDRAAPDPEPEPGAR